MFINRKGLAFTKMVIWNIILNSVLYEHIHKYSYLLIGDRNSFQLPYDKCCYIHCPTLLPSSHQLTLQLFPGLKILCPTNIIIHKCYL